MSIILSRIDDRLIHGQVTEGWCPKLKPKVVLVVSNEVNASEWHKELCLASLPCAFEGNVTSVEDAPKLINELNDDSRASYILFESPKDACTVIKNGANITKINVGGMHSTKGKREILDYVFVDDNDASFLKNLGEMGVDLDFRDLPDRENVDVLSRL